MKEEAEATKSANTGIRKLPQYITDQLLLAIDNVRAGRMKRSDMDFQQCTIKVYQTGRIVRIDLQDILVEAPVDAGV